MWREWIVLVAAGLSSAIVGAAEPASGCDLIAGEYLVEGTQTEGNSSSAVYYLERVNQGQSQRERHHFTIRYDREKQVLDAAVFDIRGAKLCDFQGAAQYLCKGSLLVREYDVRGGSEGCSKQGHMRSQIDIGPSGELRFTTTEHWEFGALCFAQPRDSQRVSVFPKFEGRQ